MPRRLSSDLARAFQELDRNIKRAERRGRDAAKKVVAKALNEERRRWPRKTGRSAKSFTLRARTFPGEIRFTVKNSATKLKRGARDYYAEHIDQGTHWRRLEQGIAESGDKAVDEMAKALEKTHGT